MLSTVDLARRSYSPVQDHLVQHADSTFDRLQAKELRDFLPFFDEEEGFMDTCFVPLVHDLSWYWGMEPCVGEVAANHPFAGYPAQWYVLREYPHELYHYVKRKVIADLEEYEEYQDHFNDLYERVVVKGEGGGAKDGMASEEEMIALGSLFWLLQVATSKRVDQVKSDKFVTRWDGTRSVVQSSLDDLVRWSRQLEDVSFSDMNLEHFFGHYRDVEDGFWFLVWPEWSQSMKVDMDWKTLLDEIASLPDNSRQLVLFPDEDGNYADAFIDHHFFDKQMCRVALGRGRRWCSESGKYRMYPDKLDGYTIVSNYFLKQTRLYRPFSEVNARS